MGAVEHRAVGTRRERYPGDDIGVLNAWPHTTGSGVTVGAVDTGADYSAPDLAGRLLPGQDFVNSSNAAQDQNGHGTLVAGIITADQNNNVGVTGVAPAASVLPLRALDASGSGTLDAVAAAFDYAGDHGYSIVNASLGGPDTSQTLADAVTSHPGTLYVVAAGNGDSNNVGYDVDATPFYPCDIPAANLICVGASDQNDQPAGFSNYGAANVDLFAPGVNILSVYRGSYAYADGTSAAAPMVSGALALMKAYNPSLTAAQLKSDLLSSVDQAPQLAGVSVTGGEVDAAAAVAAAGGDPPDAPTVTLPVPSTPTAPATGVTSAPGHSAGTRLTHLALLGKRDAGTGPTLVFTLSARARVQITLARSARKRGAAADVLLLAVTARKGQNRYALSELLRGRHLARGAYRLTIRAGNRTATLGVTV